MLIPPLTLREAFVYQRFLLPLHLGSDLHTGTVLMYARTDPHASPVSPTASRPSRPPPTDDLSIDGWIVADNDDDGTDLKRCT